MQKKGLFSVIKELQLQLEKERQVSEEKIIRLTAECQVVKTIYVVVYALVVSTLGIVDILFTFVSV